VAQAQLAQSFAQHECSVPSGLLCVIGKGVEERILFTWGVQVRRR